MLVRFRDDEVLDGCTDRIDLDSPELSLELGEDSNARAVIVPLSAVRSMLLDRYEFETEPDETRWRKVVIRFWEGEPIHGLLQAEPERHRHGMVVSLVSPALDEVEVFAIPFAAVKGLFFVRSWDGREARVSRRNQPSTSAARPPLLNLLGEIQSLSTQRVRGDLDDVEFARRRRQVLDRI